MSYTDKNLTCSDCGCSFVFKADEQESFARLGYTNEPKRCASCRSARKARTGTGTSGFSGTTRREMFTATCAQCGQQAQVPFQPRQDRPVYCSQCYNKVRTSR